VIAHTAVAIAEPKDRAIAMEAPKQLDLTFTKSVRLSKVRIQRDKTELDIGFNLFAAATNVFAVSLPELNNASYEIN
jgi:methionine-rich copper-binding protein CopC|tara:strand:- start:115 stop:345 length:231 start_codon:yes stop_codon:yes gene_type:complete